MFTALKHRSLHYLNGLLSFSNFFFLLNIQEMRTILANVFHRFNLELSEPYKDENVSLFFSKKILFLLSLPFKYIYILVTALTYIQLSSMDYSFVSTFFWKHTG